MSDTAQAAAPAAAGRSFLRSRMVLALLLVVFTTIGGAGAYLYLQRAGHERAAPVKERPLPVYIEVKPFVVSMRSGDGASHFVQLGVNLTSAGAAAGNLINAMLPEVQDTMRLSVLSFKVEDIETPAGIDRMRARLTADINKMLLTRLGAERLGRMNGGKTEVVRNVYFSTLVIE